MADAGWALKLDVVELLRLFAHCLTPNRAGCLLFQIACVEGAVLPMCVVVGSKNLLEVCHALPGKSVSRCPFPEQTAALVDFYALRPLPSIPRGKQCE